MREYTLPSLGADMEGATLVEWKVKPGDALKRGDIIAVVETVKGAIDVEVFEDVVVEALVAQVGQYLKVGQPMATLRAPGEAAAPAPAPPPVTAPVAAPVAAHLRVSPAARNLAKELGVDLSTVHGTGPNGAIGMEDVKAAAAARPIPASGAPAVEVAPALPGQPPRVSTVASPAPPTTMREAIASAMAKSKREIPHYYLQTRIDAGAAMAWLEAENRRRPVTERLLPAALLLRAVAKALREVPELNGRWMNGKFEPSAAIHLGVAINLRQGGLIAPAIHDADTLSVDALMAALLDLVKRARSGGLKGSELSDPTITVTNLGDLGVESVLGVIYPPQVAIVGFGRIVPTPWVRDGQVVARPVVTASLAADHRVSDGHRGGLFLTAVDRHLQEVPPT